MTEPHFVEILKCLIFVLIPCATIITAIFITYGGRDG